MVRAQVKLLAPGEARDRVLVEELANLINAAYAVGEAGLWVEGTTRITPDEIAEAIRSGGMLTATREGTLIGCAHVRPLDLRTADLGLLAAAPGQWGSGVGRELVRSAEELMRSRGATTMQLELLVPKGSVHREKDRLRAWYARLGYRIVRTAPFEQVAAHLTSQLAAPCEFLIFRRPLLEPAHVAPTYRKEGERPNDPHRDRRATEVVRRGWLGGATGLAARRARDKRDLGPSDPRICRALPGSRSRAQRSRTHP